MSKKIRSPGREEIEELKRKDTLLRLLCRIDVSQIEQSHVELGTV